MHVKQDMITDMKPKIINMARWLKIDNKIHERTRIALQCNLIVSSTVNASRGSYKKVTLIRMFGD